jgi:hypothetical protein
MWGETGEPLGEIDEVNPVLLLECGLAKLMLLGMMISAEADAPSVAWLQRHAAIGPTADMRAFDRELHASRNRAPMPPHPRPVRGYAPFRLDTFLALDALRQPSMH